MEVKRLPEGIFLKISRNRTTSSDVTGNRRQVGESGNRRFRYPCTGRLCLGLCDQFGWTGVGRHRARAQDGQRSDNLIYTSVPTCLPASTNNCHSSTLTLQSRSGGEKGRATHHIVLRHPCAGCIGFEAPAKPHGNETGGFTSHVSFYTVHRHKGTTSGRSPRNHSRRAWIMHWAGRIFQRHMCASRMARGAHWGPHRAEGSREGRLGRRGTGVSGGIRGKRAMRIGGRLRKRKADGRHRGRERVR